MKILICTDTYYPHVNGASYFAQRLVIGLHKRGHDVLVVAPSKTWKNKLYYQDEIPIQGLSSSPTFVKNGFRFVPPVDIKPRLRQIVEEFKPDVIHLQGHLIVPRAMLAVAKENNIPVIGTNHFMPENLVHYLHLPPTMEQYIKQLAWEDFRNIFSQFDEITTPTATAASLLEGIGLNKIVRPLSCGIDCERFRPEPRGDYLKQRYGLPDRPILIYVGRLDKEKNLDVVLGALAAIQPTQRPHLIIAGKGAEEKALKELARELQVADSVTFTGFVPDEDLPALYTVAHCFVMAGTAELQSIVTMEAMASGLPIIATDMVALPELVHDGENGYLFPARDTAKLAECIEKLFSDEHLRQAMGQKSLEIVAKHDSRKVLGEYEDLYRHAIASHQTSQEQPDATNSNAPTV